MYPTSMTADKEGEERISHAQDGDVPRNQPSSHLDYDEEADFDDFKWNRSIIINLFSLYMIFFACTWGNSIPSTGYAFIVREFPNSSTASWITALPGMVLCVASMMLGQASDALGRRYFVIVGGLLGFLGLILGGLGKSIEVVVAGQVFNSIGLSLGYLATPLLAELVPKKTRGTVVSISVMLVGLLTISGSLMNGAFTRDHVGGFNKGWRVGWYLGAGFYGISVIMLFLFYHPVTRTVPEGHSRRQHILKLDWPGWFIGATSLAFLVVALQLGGNSYAWDSSLIISFLVIGCVFLVFFFLYEWKATSKGMFHHDLFEHRNYAISLLLNFIEGVMAFGATAYFMQEIFLLYTHDSFKATACGLGNAAGVLIGAIIANVVIKQTKESKWIVLGGLVSFTIGCGVLAAIRPHVNYAYYFFGGFLLGVKTGILGSAIPVISSVCTPGHLIASTISTGTSVRGLGGAIGSTMCAQIFTSKAEASLPKYVAKAALQAGLPASSLTALMTALLGGHAAEMAHIPDVTPKIISAAQDASLRAYADSFRLVWVAFMPITVTIFVASLWLKPTKHQLTSEVVAHVEGDVKKKHLATVKPDYKS